MIIYLCIKFQSNIPILSEDIARKPFFKVEKGHNSQNNWWILPKIELDLHFMIIHLCIKFQSNIPILSKDIARKLFVLCTGRTGQMDGTDSGDTICPPLKMAGHKKSNCHLLKILSSMLNVKTILN